MRNVTEPRFRVLGAILAISLAPLQAASGQGIFESHGALNGALNTGKKSSGQANAVNSVYNATRKAAAGAQNQRAKTAGGKSKSSNTGVAGARPTVSREQVTKAGAQATELFKKAQTEQEKGELDEAVKDYNSSYAIRETYWRGRDRASAVILTRIGEIYLKQNKLDDALVSLDKALGYYGALYGPGSNHRVEPLKVMGDVYEKQGNDTKAVDCFNQAYMLVSREKGVGSPEAVKLGIATARGYRKLESYQSAAQAYSKVLPPNGDGSGTLSPEELRAALTEYKDVLEKLSRTEDAESVASRLKQLGG